MADQESSTTQYGPEYDKLIERVPRHMLRHAWIAGGSNSEGAMAFIRANFDKPKEFWLLKNLRTHKSPVFHFGSSSPAGGASPSTQAAKLQQKIEGKKATKAMLQSMGEDSTQLDNEIADLQTRIEQSEGGSPSEKAAAEAQARERAATAKAEEEKAVAAAAERARAAQRKKEQEEAAAAERAHRRHEEKAAAFIRTTREREEAARSGAVAGRGLHGPREQARPARRLGAQERAGQRGLDLGRETMVTMILEQGGEESKETLSSLKIDKLWEKLEAAGITQEIFLERLEQGQGGGYRKKRKSKKKTTKRKKKSKKRQSKKRQSKKRKSKKRKSRKRLKTRKRR